MFYVNIFLSQDSGVLETLGLRTRIIFKNLFQKSFNSNFSGVIPYMNGTCPNNFKVSIDDDKKVASYQEVSLFNFGPLSLYYKYRILSHIITTTLIPRKVLSVSDLSRCVYIVLHGQEILHQLGCMVPRLQVGKYCRCPYLCQLTLWNVDYKDRSHYFIDISKYITIKVSAIYDSKTFVSMGYVQLDT